VTGSIALFSFKIYDNYENSYKCFPAKKNTASIAGRLERGNNDAAGLQGRR
jgi:hypothetical protein